MLHQSSQGVTALVVTACLDAESDFTFPVGNVIVGLLSTFLEVNSWL